MNATLIRIKNYLGLKRNIVIMLVLIMLILTGEKMWERFLPKYLDGIGSSVWIIGGFGFLQNMLTSFWSLPGGYIADWLGNKRAFLIFNIMAIGGYSIAIIFTSWIAVFIGMLFFYAWNSISLPASMSVITKSLGGKKTAMGISMHSIIRRVPMMIGPIIGGFLITYYGLVLGIKYAFGLSITLCLIGLLLQHKMVQDEASPIKKLSPISLWKGSNPKLKNLLVSDILIRFCEQIPYVFVVLWCLNIIKTTPEQFGILTAIEMIVSVLVYIPVAHFSDKLERKPFVLITFIFFAVFPMILYFSRSFIMLIFAFVIRGLKEFGEPTRKAMILELSLKGAEARSFGLYYFIRDFIVSFAAFAGGWLWSIGAEYNFFAAFIFGVLGTIYFGFFGKGTELLKAE